MENEAMVIIPKVLPTIDQNGYRICLDRLENHKFALTFNSKVVGLPLSFMAGFLIMEWLRGSFSEIASICRDDAKIQELENRISELEDQIDDLEFDLSTYED